MCSENAELGKCDGGGRREEDEVVFIQNVYRPRGVAILSWSTISITNGLDPPGSHRVSILRGGVTKTDEERWK